MGSSCVPAKTRAEHESSCRTRRASQPRRKHCELRADQLGVTGILPGGACLCGALVRLLAIVVSCDKESVGTPCWLCLWHAPSPASRPYLPHGMEMRKSRLFACPNVSGSRPQHRAQPRRECAQSNGGGALSAFAVTTGEWRVLHLFVFFEIGSPEGQISCCSGLVVSSVFEHKSYEWFYWQVFLCRYNLLKSWKQSLIFFNFLLRGKDYVGSEKIPCS